nr:hypothetical protein [uncultured Desulfobacter sp.]
MDKYIPDHLVLITHDASEFKSNPFIDDNYICFYNVYVQQLLEGFRSKFSKVHHYLSPDSFLKNIHLHQKDIIISIWGTGGTRNKKNLIPSICEIRRIKYFGGDTYVQSLCQDKYLSNLFAQEKGLKTPAQILIDRKSPTHLLFLSALTPPFIVKPTIEGESIGLTSANVCNQPDKALELAYELLAKLEQAIVVEEYIEGDELNVVIFGTPDKILIFEEILLEGVANELAFYDYHKKRRVEQTGLVKKQVFILNNDTKTAMRDIFKTLRNAECLRIDGKIKNGDFYFIEFTQDSGMSRDSVLHTAFRLNGYNYSGMLYALIENAAKNPLKY